MPPFARKIASVPGRPYGLTAGNGAQAVQSLEGTSGVVAGLFDDRPGMDLVAVNSGTNSLVMLSETTTAS